MLHFYFAFFVEVKNGMQIFTLILEQKCKFALCGLVLQKRFTSMIPRWIAMDLVKQNDLHFNKFNTLICRYS